MIAVYVRYGVLSTEERDTLDSAWNFLEYGSDDNQLFIIGVYDPSTNTVHIRHGDYPVRQGEILRRIRDACELPADHQFRDIQYYRPVLA